MENLLEIERLNLQKANVLKAEQLYYERLYKGAGAPKSPCILVSEIAKAREHIKNSLEQMDGIATFNASVGSSELLDRVAAVEKDNFELRVIVGNIQRMCLESRKQVLLLQEKFAITATNSSKKIEHDKKSSTETTNICAENFLTFDGDKSKTPAVITKSSLILDIKLCCADPDLKIMDSKVRRILLDGVIWGESTSSSVAFGVQKLSIPCVIEDDKISVNRLIKEIENLGDYVESVDIAALNKI